VASLRIACRGGSLSVVGIGLGLSFLSSSAEQGPHLGYEIRVRSFDKIVRCAQG